MKREDYLKKLVGLDVYRDVLEMENTIHQMKKELGYEEALDVLVDVISAKTNMKRI